VSRGSLVGMAPTSPTSIPKPTRHDPPVSARCPGNIQRAARARAEILGVTYGQYISWLILQDTADNVGILIADEDDRTAINEAAS
jgi:hypothetical protein